MRDSIWVYMFFGFIVLFWGGVFKGFLVVLFFLDGIILIFYKIVKKFVKIDLDLILFIME